MCYSFSRENFFGDPFPLIWISRFEIDMLMYAIHTFILLDILWDYWFRHLIYDMTFIWGREILLWLLELVLFLENSQVSFVMSYAYFIFPMILFLFLSVFTFWMLNFLLKFIQAMFLFYLCPLCYWTSEGILSFQCLLLVLPFLEYLFLCCHYPPLPA